MCRSKAKNIWSKTLGSEGGEMDIFGKYASCQKLAVKINTTLSWVSAGIKQRESSHFSKRCIFHLFSKCLNCTGGLNSIHQKDNGLFWCFWRSLSAPNYFAEDTLKEFSFLNSTVVVEPLLPPQSQQRTLKMAKRMWTQGNLTFCRCTPVYL